MQCHIEDYDTLDEHKPAREIETGAQGRRHAESTAGDDLGGGQPGAADRDAVVAMQAMLADVGIIASVDFPEAGAYNQMRGTTGWEGILVHRVLNMTHMQTTLVLLYSQANNFFYSMRFSDELDDLIQAATAVLGDNNAELVEAQNYILDNLLVIPMWFAFEATIVSPNIRGWNPEFDLIFYEEMWFAD